MRETETEALYLKLTFTVKSWLFVAADNVQKAKRYLPQEMTFSSLALVYVHAHSLKSVTKSMTKEMLHFDIADAE